MDIVKSKQGEEMQKQIVIPESILTERLFLRLISLEDKTEMFKEFTSEVTTFMYPKPASSIDETENFIRHSIETNSKGTNCQMVIVDAKTKAFIGCVGLHNLDSKTPEFGIWLKVSAAGNGFGKEAVQALKTWADANTDSEYYLYPVDKNNIASKKIPESMNGKVEREYQEVNSSGRQLDILEYRIYPQTIK